MLYSHDDTLTIDSLRDTYRVPTVEELKASKKNPNAGNRWTPVHHADLVSEIVDGAESRGLQIAETQLSLSKDGHDIFGHLRFEAPSWFEREDMSLVLGFRSSNMQRFRLLGVTGSRVVVCANGMISGEFVFGFKRTSGENFTDSGVKIMEGMGKWEGQARELSRLVEHMETVELTERDADHFMIEGVRQKAFSSSQIARIDDTYRGFAEDGNQYREAFGARNAWSLYNAVTEVAKGSGDSVWSPRRVENSMKVFPRLIAAETGFEMAAPVEEISIN